MGIALPLKQEICGSFLAAPCLDDYYKQLASCFQPDGGYQFLPHPQSESRPDATAWAIFTLVLSGHVQTSLELSRNFLTTYQHEDGRVSIDADHPEAYWPTPLAIFAWHASPAHANQYRKAVQFLLESSGEHWTKQLDSPLKHDTAIRGWSWIDQTHSWVESTSMAMIALHFAGHTHHPRSEEATALLLNRQLPHGGWNYGNTEVFGNELRPSPEDTGAALSALAGRVSETQIASSLKYLSNQVQILRTPIALGWSILGLNAWNKTPQDANDRILDTLNRGKRFGGYDTPSLCLLLAALAAPRGLANAGFFSTPTTASTTTTASPLGM